MDSISKFGRAISGATGGQEASSVDKATQATSDSGTPDASKLDGTLKSTGKGSKVMSTLKAAAPLVADVCKCVYGTVEPWVVGAVKLLIDAIVEVCKVVISEIASLAAGEVTALGEGAVAGVVVPG